MSLYDDLGVEPDATTDQINAAYRRLAKNAHPDAGGDVDEFVKLSRAVNVLRNPKSRSQYDADGTIDDAQRTEDAEANEMLTSLFQQAFQNVVQMLGRFDQIDVILELRKLADKEIRLQLAEKETALRAQRHTANAIDRLVHIGSGPNILGRMLEQQAETIGRALEAMERRIRVIELARAKAADWNWKTDPPVTHHFPYAPTGATPSSFSTAT